MATPSLIYAIDNLGPNRFTELCALLLASRYKGFILGGVGADGGVDAEIDETLGIWHPESTSPLLNEIIEPGKRVVFQFKHKVTARVGQAQSRRQLLNLYQCKPPNEKCELHRKLIMQECPYTYVLVTNVEVNSNFRKKFIEQCKSENAEINHYQIIGLDELETWIKMEPDFRHLYFPDIYGPPRFNLKIKLSDGYARPLLKGIFFEKSVPENPTDLANSIDCLQISVLNVGTVSSHIRSIAFKSIMDGEQDYFYWDHSYQKIFDEILSASDLELDRKVLQNNPELGMALQPGRRLTYNLPFSLLRWLKEYRKGFFPVEVLVYDEVDNVYYVEISENLRNKILAGKSHIISPM